MSEIKKYLDYAGLQQYDGLIKSYIQTRDGYVAGSCEFIQPKDGSDPYWQYTKDGKTVTLSLSALYDLIVSAQGTADGAIKGGSGDEYISVTTSGTDLVVSATEKTTASLAKADSAIQSVKVNGTALTPDASKAVDITIPDAKVTGVDGTTVNGMKLSLEDTKVKLVDDGLASTLTGKNITLTTATNPTEGYLKTYVLTQGTTEIGKIDLPKELVVNGGEIVEVGGVKYLRLTIANQDAPVDIAVTDLVDAYTPGAGIAINEKNEVSIALNPTQGNVVLSTDGGLKATLTGWDTINTASHTHSNKTILDSYTQTEADLADAVAKKHEHTNKAVLDGITAEKVSNWDGASTDSHTHGNKTVLDGITAEKVTVWDGKQQALTELQLAAVNSGINATDWSSVKTAVDNLNLGDYYTKIEVDNLLADKLDADALVAITTGEISALFA